MMCVHGLTTAAAGRFWKHPLRKFTADQQGSTTVFAMTLFMLMVMMGGLAVDLMRYEATRTSLQNTLDRATLAAASLNQSVDGKVIVKDYFAKANLTQYLKQVTVTNGINFRNVKAYASAETDPYFAQLVGVEELQANGKSMAEQRVTNVEIMLVLDVSGSMNSNSRLTNLKTAASEFVNTVLAHDTEKHISIGLVPFNGQVNLPVSLRDKFNFSDNPNATDVNCFDLPPSVYTTSGISRTVPISMTAYADTYSGTDRPLGWTTNKAAPNLPNVWCRAQPENTITMPTQSIADLQARINGLTGVGATSINMGLKWGTTLMDPSSRSIFNEFQTAGLMPTTLAGRPFENNDREAIKIIVLMTDGEHWADEKVVQTLKSGASNISRSDVDNNYSIFHADAAGTNKFWVPHLGTWQATAWTNSSNSGTATLQTWPQVWASMRQSYVAWQFYGRAFGGNDWNVADAHYWTAMNGFREVTPTVTMDAQLQGICGLAKSNSVIVYGIAFEAPLNGQTQIRDCATSDSHYYNAAGLQIGTAFRSIASNISQLRLTQ